MKNPTSKWSNIFSKKILNVCILGGGNIGTLLLGDLGRKENLSVRLYTTRPDRWNHRIDVCNVNNTIKYSSDIDKISDNPNDVIYDADIIISTYPSHIFPSMLHKIKASIRSGTWLGFMPGSGGSEFYSKELIEKGCLLFGFQRVHGISRIKEYGKSVYDLGKKSELYIGTIPAKKAEEVCAVMEDILDMKCYPLPNYLNVTLTPSNPILHTSRIYTMFHDYKEGIYWDREINFYEEWTDEASEVLIKCDEELQAMCKKINGLDLSGVVSLKKHYESETKEMMTNKLCNITAFKGIKAPMIKTEKGYIPDSNSRYFLEDFPYGLCIIKGFCDVVDLDTPMIDKVLMWFEKFASVEYYINGEFKGKDLKGLPLPKNYGLHKVSNIVSYYL